MHARPKPDWLSDFSPKGRVGSQVTIAVAKLRGPAGGARTLTKPTWPSFLTELGVWALAFGLGDGPQHIRHPLLWSLNPSSLPVQPQQGQCRAMI